MTQTSISNSPFSQDGNQPSVPSETGGKSSPDLLFPEIIYESPDKHFTAKKEESPPNVSLNESFSESVVEQVKVLCEKYQHPHETHSLLSLITHGVTLETLQTHLNEVDDAKNQVMFNTYVSIAHQLTLTNRVKNIYQKRIMHEGQRLTHAFAISSHHIYVVPEGNPLGEGATKTISAAFSLLHPEEFVRGKIDLSLIDRESSARDEGDLIKEIHVRAKEECIEGIECIVPPHDFCIIESGNYRQAIFFQKRFNGDGNLLKDSEDEKTGAIKHISTKQLLSAIRDTARALSVLHQLGYVHMDVKPANILIQGDVASEKTIQAKLCDFGATVKKKKHIKYFTTRYMDSQEIEEAHFFHDQFSLGVTLFEILLGRPPKTNLGQLDQKTLDNCFNQLSDFIDQKDIPESEKKCQLQLCDIARQLTLHDTTQRMSCAEAEQKLSQLLVEYTEES